MRICRFEHNGEAHTGALLEDGRIQPLSGSIYGQLEASGEPLAAADVRLLVPVLPTKIVAVGRNYRAHAEEMGKPVPEEPLLFLKATSALLPTEFTIRLPAASQQVDHEAELAVVISKPTRKVTPEQARDHVLGFTCFNDVTARDIQRKEVQFTRAKGYDTFAPMGPYIETQFDPTDKGIVCKVNGNVKQSGRTTDMVFDVWTLISFASQAMTLLPGDVLVTGTPAGVGPLQPGDVVEVEIEGLGTLKNHVEKESEA